MTRISHPRKNGAPYMTTYPLRQPAGSDPTLRAGQWLATPASPPPGGRQLGHQGVLIRRDRQTCLVGEQAGDQDMYKPKDCPSPVHREAATS
jgi:hypothetical protein